jgi:membrane protease subunit (stomatin/prohibitin family)
MGLFSKLMGEFIDIIEWVDADNETIVWKFPRYQNEIKMGAKLTVRESQVAVFMNEGVIADVFLPGMHTLSTQNMPILSTLKGWKYAFNSPFKADVFFVSAQQFLNQKWGTKHPVIVRDAEFGPVRLRAFGAYAFRVTDAKQFIKEVSATNPEFETVDILDQMRNIISSKGMDVVASSGIGLLDMTANYEDVSKLVFEKIQPDFNELGLTLTKFLVENISVPPEVETMMDKRTSMGVLGNLGAFAQFEAANSMEKVAENPNGGGLAAAGMALGMGAGMMQQVGNMFQPNQFNGVTPPPLPQTAVAFHVAVEGKQQGPFSIEALTGMVNKETLVWKAGMAAWVKAGTVAELAALFNNVPPPLTAQ